MNRLLFFIFLAVASGQFIGPALLDSDSSSDSSSDSDSGEPLPSVLRARSFGLLGDIFGSLFGGGGGYQRPLPGPGFDLAPAKPRKCPWREEKACEGYGPQIFKPPPPPRPPTRLIIDYKPPSFRPPGASPPKV